MSAQICFDGFIFDVADSVGVVVAAGDGVTVFSDAQELAEEASAQEKVVVPVVEVGHAALFGDSGVEGYVDVDGGFAVVLGGEVVEFVAYPLVLGWGEVSFEAGWVVAVGNHAVENHPASIVLFS